MRKYFSHLGFFITNRQAFFVGIIFLSNSFMFGNWVVRIPDVKQALDLTDLQLGLALLGAPVGAILVLPFSAWFISRFKLGTTVLFSSLLHSSSIVFLAFAGNLEQLMGALFIFGLTNAVMDVSMNAAASVTEHKLDRHIMSSCHGMWSLGAMFGSAFATVILNFGIDYRIHLLLISMSVFLFYLIKMKRISSYKEEVSESEKVLAFPNLTLLLLSLMGFCIMVSEGALADWSAIYMKEALLSPDILVGISYSSYSLFMALGRFSGDALIPEIGKKRVAIIGGFLGAAGLGMTLLIANSYFSILGFGLTGLGFSCIIPVIFSSAANEPGYSRGAGLASVTVIGYFGFLAGPPAIGYLSEQFGIANALFSVVILSALVAVISSSIRFR